MNDKDIELKLSKVIILLHECGYDRDFMMCPEDQRIAGSSGGERFKASEIDLSLVSAYYHDQSGLSTAIFTVDAPNGEKGILLARHNGGKDRLYVQTLASHLMIPPGKHYPKT
ncbi:hypothetical protein [Mucilaginibacter sp. SJ]|uniref:hypothetical protein n=1 Tax=Mucilaginibacter sp. SJ TaxID=3029053 RepID=UPI0023A99899|nr:hypothetical protein [Mucilaginibacter sp. SJ]WEA01795.1 hypothetical protein MusilaSJ_02515 [Mucilaginibacter sp. SJ]